MTYSESPENPTATQGVRLTKSWNRWVAVSVPSTGDTERTLSARSVAERIKLLQERRAWVSHRRVGGEGNLLPLGVKGHLPNSRICDLVPSENLRVSSDGLLIDATGLLTTRVGGSKTRISPWVEPAYILDPQGENIAHARVAL
jgi:hypothetical protein